MRNFLTLLWVALFTSLSLTAQNLVPNPGFETYVSCPNSIGLITYEPNYLNFPTAMGWVSPTQNGSPDYFNVCATMTSNVHVPETVFGYQYAHRGDAFAGIIAWHARKSSSTWVDETREYIQCKLLQPLQAGQRYCFTFFASASVTSNFNYNYVGLDKIGINFSTTKTNQTTGNVMSLTPQISSPAGIYFTDTSGWVKISEIYTATGGEEWITIGCFGAAPPSFIPINTATSDIYRSYLFFDDFNMVKIVPGDTVTVASDSAVCDKKNVSLTLNSSGGEENFIWSNGATGASIHVDTLGTFWCRSFANCQLHIDTFHVIYDPKIKLSLGRDTGNCFNQPFELKAPPGFTNLLWSTGATSSSIIVAQPGLYTLRGTNKCGTYTDTIKIYIQPPTPTPIVSDTFLCQFTNQPNLNVQGSSLLWYQSMSSFIGSAYMPYIDTHEPGEDVVYVTQTLGKCESERVPIHMKILYQPRKELQPEITMCEKYVEMIGKELPDGVSYKWSTGATSCCIKPAAEGLYKLAVINECGLYIDTIRVHFSVCDICVTAPNAFTPNHDGHNDEFKAIITCPIDNFRIVIFNRWGNKVFETTDPDQGWDGMYKGIYCENGTYVYVLQYRSASTYGINTLKGTINLLR